MVRTLVIPMRDLLQSHAAHLSSLGEIGLTPESILNMAVELWQQFLVSEDSTTLAAVGRSWLVESQHTDNPRFKAANPSAIEAYSYALGELLEAMAMRVNPYLFPLVFEEPQYGIESLELMQFIAGDAVFKVTLFGLD